MEMKTLKNENQASREDANSQNHPPAVRSNTEHIQHERTRAQRQTTVSDDHQGTPHKSDKIKSKKKQKKIDSEIQNQPAHTSYTSEVQFDEEEPIDYQGQTVKQANRVDVAAKRSTKSKRRVSMAIPVTESLVNPSEPNTIESDPSPIIGYAAEPLLSLPAACAPLFDILHNLSFYVQLALDETPDKPPHGLTVHESAAIRLYTLEWEAPHKSLYSMLNYTLKFSNREELLPYFKYMKLFLTALVKIPWSQLRYNYHMSAG
ncbi:unnamed protein product [Rotaria sordida]|uniref:Uncharacterized protein n=1 Tax=Rotaria sordida TaxID=392033 RepID=A0A820D065_9BILA|nr:unnamed protein product [Rotaria sordida]